MAKASVNMWGNTVYQYSVASRAASADIAVVRPNRPEGHPGKQPKGLVNV